MEKLDIELRKEKKTHTSFQVKVSNFYKRNKFPITVEPLLFFLSMAFGLSEVILKKLFKTLDRINSKDLTLF